ncbi:MAG: nuclear transport factor 2 family protein, partial [Mycobacterium sp.]
MSSLPRISLDSSVDPTDGSTAIDFINRVNLLFDAGDIDAMVEAFLPDSTTFHTGGVTHGQTEMRRFFQQAQPYSGAGVSRIATNPIVDADDDGEGVIVRYHNLIVRYSTEAPSSIVTGQVQETPEDLPAIWVYSAMTDRLRRHGRGWRIFERY